MYKDLLSFHAYFKSAEKFSKTVNKEQKHFGCLKLSLIKLMSLEQCDAFNYITEVK